VVELSLKERQYLRRIVERRDGPSRRVLHARILLLADQGEEGRGLMDAQIAGELGISSKTVGRVRERYFALGLPHAIERKEHRNYKPRRLDDDAAQQLLELAQQKPPDGHDRWTLRLLADRLVELKIVPEISHETVRRQLNGRKLSGWPKVHRRKLQPAAAAAVSSN
jgi:transposase